MSSKTHLPDKLAHRKPAVPHESLIQRAFIKYCRMYPDKRVRKTFSIKNSGRKDPKSYGRDIAEGLLAGVADVCVPYPTETHHALFLEFKHGKGKPTESQVEFQEFCEEYDYRYEIVRSVDEAIKVLEEHISPTKYMLC